MILSGPGVFLTAEDCLSVDRHVLEAIQLAYLARRRPPPHALLALADQIHQCSERFRASVQVEAGSGRGDPRTGPHPPPSDQTPVWLTSSEAAGVAKISESYVRRLARRGDVEATRSGQGGAWMIDAATLQVWLSGRTEPDRKAS